ncbi:MAG: energy transducer TonB [Gammaproteobacteria bacterium]
MAAKYEDRSIGGMPGALPLGREVRLTAAQVDRGLLDDTLPPQPLKDLLSTKDANLFVLSADPDLIDTVRRASGDQYPVFAVEQWAELEAAVFAGRCGIAFLDSELVGSKLFDHIAALETQASRVVTLVAANRGVAQELMGYLSDRRIHRLLIKPAALGITRLLVESALNRCVQLRDTAAASVGLEMLGGGSNSERVRRWPRMVFGAVVVIGVIAAAWLWRSGVPRDRATEPAQPSSSASPNVGEAGERFADLLNRAAQAFDAGRLVAPTGDNALDDYLTVLAMDPGDATARARLAVVVDALFAQAESALLANSLGDATTALAGVRRVDSASSRLAFLEAQLERATAARAAASAVAKRASAAREAAGSPGIAQSELAAAAPTELDSLLVIATARLARGQLLDPTGDSALEYLRRATEINGNDARVVRGRAALSSALLEAARVAIGRDGVDDAARLISAARDLGASAEALTAVEIDFASVEQAAAERRHAEWLALASDRLRAGALAEPAGDSALDYLLKVQTEAPNAAGLSGAWDAWIAAQSARARQAFASRSWAAGETALSAIAAAPRGPAVVAPLREQLETERLQTQYLAAASAAGELKLLDAPPSVYPSDALRLNIQGWVELEFVVDRSGQPKNLAVVTAEPTGRFDQAALAAVAKYRYAPFERGGHVYERRARLRIRFALN